MHVFEPQRRYRTVGRLFQALEGVFSLDWEGVAVVVAGGYLMAALHCRFDVGLRTGVGRCALNGEIWREI